MRALTEDELELIRAVQDQPRVEREARLPDEETAIAAFLDGYGRLVELGWEPVSHRDLPSGPHLCIALGHDEVFQSLVGSHGCLEPGSYSLGLFVLSRPGLLGK